MPSKAPMGPVQRELLEALRDASVRRVSCRIAVPGNLKVDAIRWFTIGNDGERGRAWKPRTVQSVVDRGWARRPGGNVFRLELTEAGRARIEEPVMPKTKRPTKVQLALLEALDTHGVESVAIVKRRAAWGGFTVEKVWVWRTQTKGGRQWTDRTIRAAKAEGWVAYVYGERGIEALQLTVTGRVVLERERARAQRKEATNA